MIKYLEIDSTYRNRKEYPNPAKFDLITAQSGTRSDLTTSISPISLAAPIVTYVPDSIGIISNQFSNVVVQESNTNTSTSLIVCFNKNQNANRTPDYYRGIQANITVSSSPDIDIGRVTIDSWDYLNRTTIGSTNYDCFRVSISPAISPELIKDIKIFQLFSSTNFDFGHVFIPSGTATSQIYKDYFIYNETLNQSAIILAYDGKNSLASITPPVGWATNHTISLRKELPQSASTFQAGSTKTTVVLNNNSNPVPDSLVGSFLRITQPGSLNQNKICDIISYEGSPTFKATLNSSLPVAPSQFDKYEIISFNNDGFVPLNYSGTHVSQEICYEIQLVNLIIPNVGVKSGGIISSYPYLYVDFQNFTTSSGGTTNLIYSNNPNSVRKLFRIPVTDISPPSMNSFVRLDKCSMTQIVRISPYNSFKFGIYLPDGRPLELSISDTSFPTPPDPALQVSALFSLKRMQ